MSRTTATTATPAARSMSGPSMYRRLLHFLRPHRWRMAGTIASNIVAAALDVFSLALLVPFLRVLFADASTVAADTTTTTAAAGGGALGGSTSIDALLRATVGRLVDPTDRMGSLRTVVLIILATVLLKNLFVWLSGQLGARLQEYVTRDIRDSLYDHMTRLPLRFFHETKGGQILSRVLNDTAQTKQVITQLVTQSLQNTALVVFYIVGMTMLSWKLTLLALVAAPALIGGLQPLLGKLRRGYRRIGNQHGEMTSVVQETVSGIRLVKSFSGEGYERRRFREASDRYSSAMVRVTRVAMLAQPLTEVAGTAIAVLVLWVGARDVLVNRTMAGEHLITFLLFVTRLLQPLKSLSQIPTTAQASLAAAERVFEVIDAPSETQRDTGTRSDARLERGVSFENVAFAYDDEPVLRDISFEAPRGTVVALVGASGAGKSTLVDLIPRFYEVSSGRVLLDGVDTREFTLASLRRLTGIVSQDTVLFNDTVRHNVAYGAEGKYTQEQVEAAARAANAHAFIMQLPEGYETVLGERGTRLSGGQRQRLAIARALLTDPPILILDEATSALDTESERLVQEAIERLLAGRTVFVIAHRLSTIEHADQILVLEAGRIVERGTHAALLAQRGAYHRLHTLQFRDAGSGGGTDARAELAGAVTAAAPDEAAG